MTKTHYWLGGLLVLQLLIAAGLLWQGGGDRTARQEPFLAFEPDKIDGIKISDRDNTVTLVKEDGNWLLPDLERLPAAYAKIEGILTKLKNFKPAWPVATTAASHSRFEVAGDKFQRKAQFYQGETLAAEWYLGTSPGFRKSHIRKEGDDGIYTIVLSAFDLPVKDSEWQNKALLGANGITAIKGPDYALEKVDDAWRFAKSDTTEGEAAPELDQDKALQLASALTGLQVLGIADKAPDNIVKTLEVSTPEGSWTYNFMQADGKYFVSRNDRKTVFALSQFDFDRIAQIDSAKLVKAKTEFKTVQDEAIESIDQRPSDN